MNVPAEELAKVPAAVGVLGGRLSDLESLVVRFRAGKGIERTLRILHRTTHYTIDQ